jgi:hypothetical protein
MQLLFTVDSRRDHSESEKIEFGCRLSRRLLPLLLRRLYSSLMIGHAYVKVHTEN